MDDGDKSFVPNPDVAFREIDGAVVIVHTTGNRLLQLNETGSTVWRLLEGRSTREISLHIAHEFDVEPSAALADTVRFLASLQERGLIVEASPQESSEDEQR